MRVVILLAKVILRFDCYLNASGNHVSANPVSRHANADRARSVCAFNKVTNPSDDTVKTVGSVLYMFSCLYTVINICIETP